MKNKIQNSTILVLGSNPLSKKDLNYELLNLKYLPSIEQILALKPSLLIVNFNSYKAIYHSKLIKLCEDLKSIYGLPIISIEDKKDQDLSLKETENQNLFENIWNWIIADNTWDRILPDYISPDSLSKQLGLLSSSEIS